MNIKNLIPPAKINHYICDNVYYPKKHGVPHPEIMKTVNQMLRKCQSPIKTRDELYYPRVSWKTRGLS